MKITSLAALIGAGITAGSLVAGSAYADATTAQPAPVKSHLLKSADFYQSGLGWSDAVVSATGKQALSACTGELTMRGLTRGHARYASVTWSGGVSGMLTESIAQAADRAHARRFGRRLERQIGSCADEPAGHWFYGKAHPLRTDAGVATWRLTWNGDGSRAGGVVVLHSGKRVGVVELDGAISNQMGVVVKQLARVSVNRLG